jgi:hypothetical protein
LPLIELCALNMAPFLQPSQICHPQLLREHLRLRHGADDHERAPYRRPRTAGIRRMTPNLRLLPAVSHRRISIFPHTALPPPHRGAPHGPRKKKKVNQTNATMSAGAERVPAVVVGAGVVGLAVARALALRGCPPLVLDAAAQPGTGQSSRNSVRLQRKQDLDKQPKKKSASSTLKKKQVSFQYQEFSKKRETAP